VLAPGGDRIAHIVLNGLTGPINVKGQDFNNTMLAWRDNLHRRPNRRRADLHPLVEWGNNAGPITPEMVKAARAEGRTSYESSEELQKLPVQ
jgi:hypothetical protein